MKYPYGKNVFITGGTSGIGRATAELFASQGFIVYAGGLGAKEETHILDDGGEIRTIEIDVRDDAAVAKATAKAIEEAGNIGIVIHCAGMGIAGAAEDTPMEAAESQMATNYFGILRLNRIFLPHMRAQEKGLVLMISSVGGIFPIPFQSHYSSSKFAIEAYAAALRMEIKKYGVNVSLIAPGDTCTGFTAARLDAYDKSSPYYQTCQKSIAKMARDEQKGRAPISVARVALQLAQRKHPPLRKVVGIDYKLLVFARRLLPNWLIELVLRIIYVPK
jgi:NAD(P)-dependent dehydrogenase (short-subunit alcohol dehydrogenase family)